MITETTGRTRWVAWVAGLLLVVLPGCFQEANLVLEGPLDSPQWNVGASWDYHVTQVYESTGSLDGLSVNNVQRKEANITIRVIDDDLQVGGSAIAVHVDRTSEGYVGLGNVISSGIFALDPITHRVKAGVPPGQSMQCYPAVSTFDDAYWPLRFPLVERSSSDGGIDGGRFTSSVGPAERIDTVAGTFNAMPWEFNDAGDTRGEDPVHAKVWYAPEVQNFVLLERTRVHNEDYANWVQVEKTRLELVNYSLERDESARVPLEVNVSPKESGTELRLVTDTELPIRWNGTTVFGVGLEASRDHRSYQEPPPVRESISGRSGIDVSRAAVEWSATGATLVNTSASGDAAYFEVSNVSKIRVTARLEVLDGPICFGGYPQSNFYAGLTTTSYYRWSNVFTVPAGAPEDLWLATLPPATPDSSAEIEWSILSTSASLVRERGSLWADCPGCFTAPAASGEIEWVLTPDADLDVYWQPDGSGSDETRLPWTAGHDVRATIEVWPLGVHR